MCVGLVHKALLSQRFGAEHALGHHAEIGLWEPLLLEAVRLNQEHTTHDCTRHGSIR